MPLDVSAPLPDLDLAEGSTLTVELDDPAAMVTALTIHGYQLAPGLAPPSPSPLLMFTPEPLPAPGDASDRDGG